jgi:hypothetical protein
MHIRRTGDWGRARASLQGAGTKLRRAIQGAVRAEAEALREAISRRLGSTELVPLKALTVVMRMSRGVRGRRPLVAHGDLRGAIQVFAKGAEVFVGIPHKARGRSGQVLSQVAALHEQGAGPFAIRVTPAMRRAFFQALRRAGQQRQRSGSSSQTWIIRIPARPFMKPAINEIRRGISQRITARIQRDMGWR